MPDFKVGDKVKYLYNAIFLKFEDTYIIEIVHETYLKLVGFNNHLFPKECFELVERKIGDIWLKPEELYLHEKDFPLPRKFEWITHGISWINSEYVLTIPEELHEKDSKIKWKITMEEIIND